MFSNPIEIDIEFYFRMEALVYGTCMGDLCHMFFFLIIKTVWNLNNNVELSNPARRGLGHNFLNLGRGAL